MKPICIIPARGGSKGVPKKNIRKIGGKPLIAYTIKSALKSKIFSHVFVCTEGPGIARISKNFGAEVPFLRPKKLATNKSSKVAAIKHAFIEAEKFYNKKFEIIIDLDVTSPLREVKDIINSYELFLRKKADVLITGSKSRHNPYFNIIEIINGKVRKVKNIKKNFFRRQEAPKTYDMNASIYIWNRKTLLKSISSAIEKGAKWKIIFYEMSTSRSIDIDSKIDFQLVKLYLKRKQL